MASNTLTAVAAISDDQLLDWMERILLGEKTAVVEQMAGHLPPELRSLPYQRTHVERPAHLRR